VRGLPLPPATASTAAATDKAAAAAVKDPTSAPVLQYNVPGGGPARIWSSVSAAARGVGVPRQVIIDACNAHSWDLVGGWWRWLSDAEATLAAATAAAAASADTAASSEVKQELKRSADGSSSSGSSSDAKRVKTEEQQPAAVVAAAPAAPAVPVQQQLHQLHLQQQAAQAQAQQQPPVPTLAYYDPSTCKTPIPAALVRLKVELLCIGSCLPDRWEKTAAAATSTRGSAAAAAAADNPYARGQAAVAYAQEIQQEQQQQQQHHQALQTQAAMQQVVRNYTPAVTKLSNEMTARHSIAEQMLMRQHAETAAPTDQRVAELAALRQQHMNERLGLRKQWDALMEQQRLQVQQAQAVAALHTFNSTGGAYGQQLSLQQQQQQLQFQQQQQYQQQQQQQQLQLQLQQQQQYAYQQQQQQLAYQQQQQPPPVTVTVHSLALDKPAWTDRVKAASSAVQLVDAVEELEEALPKDEGWIAPWYINGIKLALRDSSCSATLAAAAARVYALDRCVSLLLLMLLVVLMIVLLSVSVLLL
jgi:hypothetical protein